MFYFPMLNPIKTHKHYFVYFNNLTQKEFSGTKGVVEFLLV